MVSLVTFWFWGTNIYQMSKYMIQNMQYTLHIHHQTNHNMWFILHLIWVIYLKKKQTKKNPNKH